MAQNEDGLENLASYIIRASFSQERMTYIAASDSSDGVSKVIYQSKDGTSTKTFNALDWLAQLVTHIPIKGNRWFVTMAIILINRAAYAKKLAPMMRSQR